SDFLLLCHAYYTLCDLLSFPTRRSSDLRRRVRRGLPHAHLAEVDQVDHPLHLGAAALRHHRLRLRPQVAPRLRRVHEARQRAPRDRKSTRLNSSHVSISYAVFCLKKKTK